MTAPGCSVHGHAVVLCQTMLQSAASVNPFHNLR